MLSRHSTLGSQILGRLGFVRQAPSKQALIVHALHKSASMFLHKFFNDLCCRKRVPYFSVHNRSIEMKTVPPGFDQSFVYGPIRSFDTNPFKALESVNHLIQVRDPRDILVSEYYSLGWIHSDKGWTEKDKQLRSAIQKVSIDEFVVNEAKFSKYSLLDR